jgi:hypothetical protein
MIPLLSTEVFCRYKVLHNDTYTLYEIPYINSPLEALQSILILSILILITVILSVSRAVSMFSFFNSFHSHPWLWSFLYVFLFRYVRAVANFIAYCLYKPIPIPEEPTFDPMDVTVIIPTTDSKNSTFHKVVESVMKHPISALIIATAGNVTEEDRREFKNQIGDRRIELLWREEPNRREQTAQALHLMTRMGTVSPIVILCDDHTFWPTQKEFVPSLLAPFEDPKIGAVGPVIEAKHHHHPVSLKGFMNFMGMTYLLRRAHEFLATNTIDGGLSCLSSRFAVFRTGIYAEPKFLEAYLNEYIWWGRVGPLNADDDKFHTRWLVNHGWKIKIQGGPESVLTTELGEWPKYHGQLLRWNRTTWRSNPRALFTERTAWRRHPYTTYAILLYSFVRMSFLYEVALSCLLYKALVEAGCQSWFLAAWSTLMLWCTGMKFAKIWPQIRKYPGDLVYFPFYILAAWCITGYKLWTLGTLFDLSWATAATKKAAEETPIFEGVVVHGSGRSTPGGEKRPSSETNGALHMSLESSVSYLGRASDEDRQSL